MVCVETLADWWNEIGCISSVFSSKIQFSVEKVISGKFSDICCFRGVIPQNFHWKQNSVDEKHVVKWQYRNIQIHKLSSSSHCAINNLITRRHQRRNLITRNRIAPNLDEWPWTPWKWPWPVMYMRRQLRFFSSVHNYQTASRYLQ